MSGDPSRRLELSTLATWAGSPLAVASLAAPLVLVAAGLAAGLVRPDRMLAAWSVRIWILALGTSTITSLAVAVRERRVASALALLAVAAALAQVLGWGALRLEGTLSAGVGEPGAPWERMEAGPLARPPAVEVAELPAAEGLARLRVDGRDVSAALGRPVELGGGTVLTVRGPFPAPAFEVQRANGDVVEKGLVKIDPAKRDWFMVGFLPHRLYLTIPEGGARADPRLPERIHLRVQRGKIRVLDRDVVRGERVPFEQVTFAFGPGDAWARVEVRRAPRVWPGLALAAALGASALALRLAGRRSPR